MRLSELEPQFMRYERRYVDGVWGNYLPLVQTLAEAQGMMFLCPVCFAKNNGAVGTHLIEISFAGKGVADEQGSHDRQGKPSRWNASGTGYGDLTTTPSILIDPALPACAGWHGFITNGSIT